jgi:L-histidine N-alpha-methyltransferase
MSATIVNQLSKPAFNQEFAEDVKLGLSAKSKYLKPKYFYDHTGSELFEEISRQPEYYLTRKKHLSLKLIHQPLQRCKVMALDLL